MHVRLYPTPAQAAILRAHCQEYISTINVLVAAVDSDVLPDGGKGTSTKDFTAALPSAVKNQALRDARSVWTRSLTLGVLLMLRTPICQWNNQNWRMEGATLLVPASQDWACGTGRHSLRLNEACGQAGDVAHQAQAQAPPLGC